LYEEIVGNPAYSSSSDTTLSQQLCTKCPHFCTYWCVRSTHEHKCVQKSKSDPVPFQFKERRQTECIVSEEDFFARARSRPDPSIISYALAGKNSQEPRSCDTFVECGSSRTEFYDNSTVRLFLGQHVCMWCGWLSERQPKSISQLGAASCPENVRNVYVGERVFWKESVFFVLDERFW